MRKSIYALAMMVTVSLLSPVWSQPNPNTKQLSRSSRERVQSATHYGQAGAQLQRAKGSVEMAKRKVNDLKSQVRQAQQNLAQAKSHTALQLAQARAKVGALRQRFAKDKAALRRSGRQTSSYMSNQEALNTAVERVNRLKKQLGKDAEAKASRAAQALGQAQSRLQTTQKALANAEAALKKRTTELAAAQQRHRKAQDALASNTWFQSSQQFSSRADGLKNRLHSDLDNDSRNSLRQAQQAWQGKLSAYRQGEIDHLKLGQELELSERVIGQLKVKLAASNQPVVTAQRNLAQAKASQNEVHNGLQNTERSISATKKALTAAIERHNQGGGDWKSVEAAQKRLNQLLAQRRVLMAEKSKAEVTLVTAQTRLEAARAGANTETERLGHQLEDWSQRRRTQSAALSKSEQKLKAAGRKARYAASEYEDALDKASLQAVKLRQQRLAQAKKDAARKKALALEKQRKAEEASRTRRSLERARALERFIGYIAEQDKDAASAFEKKLKRIAQNSVHLGGSQGRVTNPWPRPTTNGAQASARVAHNSRWVNTSTVGIAYGVVFNYFYGQYMDAMAGAIIKHWDQAVDGWLVELAKQGSQDVVAHYDLGISGKGKIALLILRDELGNKLIFLWNPTNEAQPLKLLPVRVRSVAKRSIERGSFTSKQTHRKETPSDRFRSQSGYQAPTHRGMAAPPSEVGF